MFNTHTLIQSMILLACCALFCLPIQANVVISEFLTATSNEDSQGTPLEWIELYNPGPRAVDLAGYTLSDDSLAPGKWNLPYIKMSPDSYLLVYATGYDLLDPNNYHTNFRLDRDGEFLGLFNPDRSPADSIQFPHQYDDISYGRNSDNPNQWLFYSDPTPGEENNDSGRPGFAKVPHFSQPAGVYSDPILLAITNDTEDAIIRYTLDGSVPGENSPIYSSPITLNQTTPVRARSFRDGFFPSPVVSSTFLYIGKMVFPILSVVTDPDHLFDSRTGIYKNPEKHGYEWERPCSTELIDMAGNQGFQADCGIRIHGGASRARSPKKSFRLYFRSEYGPTRLEYQLFPGNPVNRHNQLVIRGGFNDSWGYDREMQRVTATYVSDQVCRDLHLDMGQLAADGIFVELYLNGEYWGLYNITERTEEDFYRQHLGGELYDVIVDNDVRDGDAQAWGDLNRFLRETRDFANQADYEEIQAMVDLENFTSYIIISTWVQNYDWPRHNWYAAREKIPGAKWTFYLWDVEYSFGSGIQGYQINQNTFNNATDTGHTIGRLFDKLIENKDYRDYFWRQLKGYLAGSLSEEHILDRLNQRLDEVRDAIPAEAQKWGRDKTPADWENAAQLARDFVKQRTPIYLDYAERLLGPPPVAVENWSLY